MILFTCNKIHHIAVYNLMTFENVYSYVNITTIKCKTVWRPQKFSTCPFAENLPLTLPSLRPLGICLCGALPSLLLCPVNFSHLCLLVLLTSSSQLRYLQKSSWISLLPAPQHGNPLRTVSWGNCNFTPLFPIPQGSLSTTAWWPVS